MDEKSTDTPKPDEAKTEDVGEASKTWKDKLMGGVGKAMGVFQEFKETLQEYGADMLTMLASFLKAIGWDKLAAWVEQLAGNDATILQTVLKKNGVPLTQLKKPKEGDDPQAFKDQMTAYQDEKNKMEAPQTALANRYQELASTTKRGTAYTRQQFYNEVVSAWKKDHGGVKECGAAELTQIAEIANNVPDKVGEPKNLSTPEKPEDYSTLEKLAAGNADLMKDPSTKIQLGEKKVALRILNNGVIEITPSGVATVSRQIAPKTKPADVKENEKVVTTITSARLNSTNLELNYNQKYKNSSNGDMNLDGFKKVSMEEMKNFLTGVVDGRITGSFEVADFRFENTKS
ncbi:MAG: hypothetical protein PHE68_03665 [Candidatus Peribacteraceae bacterium]|nr:hypothetical protein [Candidatus Peribacteraceae bacterium]MDD5074843.1 hypothetical protein [Candidatus Peribacteraceae bacterium]